MTASCPSASMPGSRSGSARPANSMSSSAVSSSKSPDRHTATSGCSKSGAFMLDSSTYEVIPSLHPVAGAADGRGRPAGNKTEIASPAGRSILPASPPAAAATAALREPAGPRVPCPRAGRCRALRTWCADFLGALAIFATAFMMLFF